MMKNKAVKKRRFIRAVLLFVSVPFFLPGCSRAWEDIELPDDNARPVVSGTPADRRLEPSPGGVIEIKDRLFISQVNDVYINTEDYIGKTVKLEGIFKQELYPEKEEPICFVLRYGPGCCGYDGNVGFEIAWAKDKELTYPEVDSWIEVAGVVKTYEENEGFQYVYLDLVSLNVSDERGVEIVNQ